MFKAHARAARLLAKVGGWDESKHPRVSGGTPEGGQFQGGQGGGVAEGRSVASAGGDDERAKPPEIPSPDALTEKLRNLFAKQAARWLARAIGNAAFGPEGSF